ncbi:hypothetical protein N0V95_008925 [Ascochyta clinopodiicola]|nr:hypothetical protein N0V95_008925 [Ascochyta clinopodiicola]
MDPFSITASVVTLIQVSAQVTVLVKQFRDEVNVVDTTLNGILNDVDGFQQVLESMKETFAQEDIQAEVQTTGHVGSHWKNLARSLSDGEGTLDQLRSLLTTVSKSTSFLDATRKQLRLKSAIAQISGFREQIQSYRAALQLSLSTVIVWSQVTLQKSTAKLPEKIIPNLNKLYDEIRNLGADLNAKIEKLEGTVVNQGFHAESELISLTNLKECVESAADVVSTASTTLGPEGSERASAKYGSDFGDVFKKESNETMQRWMSSNTVYEFDDVEAPTLDPSETSTGDALTVYESDSDSDIDNELVRALFNNGKRRKEQGDLHDYTEAHIHGRQSLRGFRKLRKPGHDGYEKTLVLLIKICKEQENLEDEEAYAALLGSYRGNLVTQQSTPGTEYHAPQDLASPSTDAHPQGLTFAVMTNCTPQDVSLPSSRRMSSKSKSPERQEPSSSKDPQLGTLLNRANPIYSDESFSSSTPGNFTSKLPDLPASEPSFFAAELPASFTPPTPSGSQVRGPASPSSPIQNPSAMSDLHRAFSRRDLSADKFEIEDEVSLAVPPAMSPLSRFELNPLQRQVLLLGDSKCGKTWLSSAWCNGAIPKHTPSSATTFTKPMGSLEVIIQDHSSHDFSRDHLRHASYGVVHAVLLCFDISSPTSFDNVEHKVREPSEPHFLMLSS